MADVEKTPRICVVVAIDDESLRTRCEQVSRRIASTVCVVGRDSPPDQPTNAVLLTDRSDDVGPASFACGSRIAVGCVPTYAALFDAVLPAACGDDELARMIQAAGTIAVLRVRLSDREAATDRWSRLATTDSLTGLPNRLAWDEAWPQCCRRAAVDRTPLCVAILDLDEFKQVNDRHGHAVGDAVLQAVAVGVQAAIRRDDFCARLGGDEFGILLPGLTTEQAAAVLERVCSSIAAALRRRALAGTTCSIGHIVGRVVDESVAAGLYQAADRALLRAKQSGRNCICAAD